MDLKTLINYLQAANLNFLIGSGASRPFLGVLGKIEEWLTKVSNDKGLAMGVASSEIAMIINVHSGRCSRRATWAPLRHPSASWLR